jgi:hypothetical protein
MLGTLERFSRRTGPTVNRDKTKVQVVLGAQLQKARQEGAFCIDGGAIETVGSYRYLGLEVSCSGRWTLAVQALSTAGRRATHALRQRHCIEIQLYDPGLRAELFDSLVRPILLHGAEIWGATRQIGFTTFESQERDPTEQVQRSFSGVFLGLERARSGSPFWASLVDCRFLLIGSEPFHCIIIVCSVYVIAIDWLDLLLRIVHVLQRRWSLCCIARPYRRAVRRPL